MSNIKIVLSPSSAKGIVAFPLVREQGGCAPPSFALVSCAPDPFPRGGSMTDVCHYILSIVIFFLPKFPLNIYKFK